MDTEHRAEVEAKVAGRNAAYELADLYVSQSADLMRAHGKHGVVASVEFLETLRDSLVAIRPFKQDKPSERAPAPKPAPVVIDGVRQWQDWKVPDRFVLVEFDCCVEAMTEPAVLFGDRWVPKSQLLEIPEKDQPIGLWPVTKWFARKEGLVDE